MASTFSVLKERLRHCNYVLRVYDALQNRLPFVGHWNDGSNGEGFSPNLQSQLILGHRFILPWFNLPAPWLNRSWSGWRQYYQTTMELCSRLQLPITLRTTQWEDYLMRSNKYKQSAEAQKVRVIKDDGSMDPALDIFGELSPWAETGKVWAANTFISELRSLYEEPPVVLFLGNNEAPVYRWEKGHRTSVRYREYAEAVHGTTDIDEAVISGDYAQAAAEKYAMLLLSLRNNLPEKWKGALRPVWYGAHESFYIGYGRGHWNDYSPGGGVFGQMWVSEKLGLNFEPNIDLGVSAHCYMSGGWKNGQVLSPQIGAMVYPMMLQDAYRRNPNFWFEISYWDGAGRNQTAPSDSLRGWLRFLLWLGRPRVLRGFRYSNELAYQKYWKHLEYAISVVEEVHNISLLQDFWKAGNLVLQLDTETPFRAKDIEKFVSQPFRDAPRWFLLDSPENPTVGRCQKWPECEKDPVNVYALARYLNGEYLVCAHRADNSSKPMTVKLPLRDGTYQILKLAGPDGLWHVLADGSVVQVAPVV